MSTTITIPELGEGVDSVDVVSVLVEVGDRIEVDQPLIEVETEKAAVEIPATTAGTITQIHVEVGASLGPDAPIVTVNDDADGQAPGDPEKTQPIDEPDELDQVAPPESEGDASETASAPASDSESGSVSDPETVPDDAADTVTGSDPGFVPTPSSSRARPTPAHADVARQAVPLVAAAPTVRRFAREVGIDLGAVTGSGPGGRISIDDVKSAVARRLETNAGGVGLPSAELPDFSRWGEVRREPMSKVRRLTADAMSRAWLTAPQVTNHDLADITELEELRRSFKARVENAGGKLTVTAILVKVVASALKLHPTLNASVDVDAGEIIFKDFINIGVAVDTEHGLLVPVINHADRKNITEISVELADLAERARTRKLTPAEMQGGTFSISNLGGIGGTGFSPIVNWPEVAILGVSRSRVQPEWDEEYEDFEPRRMMPLSLSYDHRLVDGADAARFLRWVAEALEQPLLLALEG